LTSSFSTIGQAIETGRKMNAKNIILTHFGRFQSKIPQITDEMLQWSDVGVAFDNMQVSYTKVVKLSLLLTVTVRKFVCT